MNDALDGGVARADFMFRQKGECRSAILHLPMLDGAGEDLFTEGDVYIYLGSPSLEELAATSKRVTPTIPND